jgi:hypothetical protein
LSEGEWVPGYFFDIHECPLLIVVKMKLTIAGEGGMGQNTTFNIKMIAPSNDIPTFSIKWPWITVTASGKSNSNVRLISGRFAKIQWNLSGPGVECHFQCFPLVNN